MLSHGPLDGMLPDLQAYINRTGSIAFGDIDLSFKVVGRWEFWEVGDICFL